MNRTMKAFTVLVALALVFSMAAAVYATEAHKAKPAAETPVMPRADVLKTLPCFDCHSLDAFMAQPEAGVFSHDMHAMMSGLHCNQCHEIRGHELPNLKSGACANCHSTETINYSGGGMGKVPFSHSGHGAMFSCKQCHPDTFAMKKGGVKMTMTPMYKGKLCGSCHNGQMAFSSKACSKCHKS